MKVNNAPGKLEAPFVGPFVIVRVLDQNRLEIDEGNKFVICNIKMLKPFEICEEKQDVVSPLIEENLEREHNGRQSSISSPRNIYKTVREPVNKDKLFNQELNPISN